MLGSARLKLVAVGLQATWPGVPRAVSFAAVSLAAVG